MEWLILKVIRTLRDDNNGQIQHSDDSFCGQYALVLNTFLDVNRVPLDLVKVRAIRQVDNDRPASW